MANRGKEIKFIGEWNDILDYKIEEENFRSPNQRFLCGALESLLRHLNYDVNAMRESIDDADKDRLFRIKFVEKVNRLYQLSDPSFHFYYFDLVEPTPKKTIHVLKMLFNYLNYYCMVKKEVCAGADEVVHDYKDALKDNNSLKTKIELYKKEKDQCEKKHIEYEEQMPKLTDELAHVKREYDAIQREIADRTEDIKEMEANMMKMELELAESHEMIVTDAAYQKYTEKIAALKAEAEQMQTEIEEVRIRNDNGTKVVKNYSDTIDEINKMLKTHSIEPYEELINVIAKGKDLGGKVSELECEIEMMKKKQSNLVCSSEQNQTAMKQKELEIEKITQILASLRTKAKEQELMQNRALREKNEHLAVLREKLEELQRQKDIILVWYTHLAERSRIGKMS